MGQNTITYTISCSGGSGNGIWTSEQTHVNPNGKLIIVAGGNTGGVNVWNLPSDVVAPSNNLIVAAGTSQTLNIKGSASAGNYTFSYQCISCPGENDPPVFTVDP